ncbi:MAG: hypothetical protein JST30_05550 [Armatimonadetes bacterium]|nr:hypothetical protein [Armatimonadota bacterium]
MKTLTALVAVSLASSVSAQTWRELGPSPISGGFTGRVSAIACSATDANKYFVGGADGGVWRTTDGGSHWKNVTDFTATTSVGAVAIDPTDDNVVYVGTGEANYANHSRYGQGILKSTDGGATWTLNGAGSFAGRTVSKIVINPQNTQVLYAAVAAAGGFPEKAAAKGHPQKDGPYGVFKSTDGGVNWTQLAGGLPNQAATDLALVPSSPDTLFAAIGRPFGATENGIYKSTNGGSTWSKLAGGLPSANVGRISIATAPTDANRVYALFVNKCDAAGNNGFTLGGYKSVNGGTSWTSVPVGDFQATYGWYLCAVGVSPTNADTAVFAGYDLMRTTNGGTTFSFITPQHVDNHAVAWDASGRLLAGCDGGFFRSTNNGSSWTNFNAGLGITQFYAAISLSPVNKFLVLGGLQDNGTVQRSTDTKTWGNYIGGDGGYTAIDPNLPSREFGQFQGAGNIYRSTNSGGTWNAAGSGINGGDRAAFFTPIEVDPTTSSRILLGTHRVYRSTNGGTSWSAISADVTNGSGAIRALAISKSNPSVVWLATTDGNVSRSIDGGATFTKKLTNVPGWPRTTREISIDPTNENTVYLAVSNFGTDQVRKTTDGGTTWTPIDGDLPDVPVNVVEIDRRLGTVVLYAGTDAGVYRSSDGGSHWTRFGNGMPHCAVIDLRLDAVNNRLVAATQGRGAWEILLITHDDPSQE